MAEPQNDRARRPPDFRVQVTESLAGLADFEAFAKGKNWLVATLLHVFWKLLGGVLILAARIAGFLVGALVRGEDQAQAEFGAIAKLAVEDLFGVDVDAAAMTGRGKRSERKAAADAIGKVVMDAVTNGGAGGAAGSLAPSATGAERYMSMVTQLALEGWLEGWIVELSTLGQLETFGELDDIMAQVLGLGRMTRAVTRPLMDARVITPLEWHVNKTYTPKLLSPAEAARQIARGRGDRELWLEDLRRQGYDAQRIEAILNAQAKFHSVADVDLLVRSGQWDRTTGIRHLRDQGFEEAIAENELTLERLKRIASFERSLATAAIDAFADGRIEAFELDDFIDGNTIDSQERAQLREIADARRTLRARPLSPAEARACVLAGILAVSDYRNALRRDGRTEEATLALELLLRHELDEKSDIEELRTRQAEERAADKKARDDERATRRAEIEAERTRTRRGREGDLERAVIRGRIPLARYAEVLAPNYDADTVAIMLDLVEADRLAYVETQERRADALQRAGRKQLDVGAVERAVLAGVLTIDEFRIHPSVAALEPADVDVLARTLEARLRDRDAAEARRRELEPEAARRQIDLGKLEQLVLRDLRTLADYRRRLELAGFDVEDVDALAELLELRVAEKRAADEARDAGEAELHARGLSLEQLRRAVLRGVRTIDDYARLLSDQKFTLDAQGVLLDDLARELEEVEAARLRRDQAEAASGARELPLSVVERAARLGVISPDEYARRLEATGLDELDVAIGVELVLQQIADTQQARARRDAIDRELAPKQLSAGIIVRAMKAGLKTAEDLRALLTAQNYSAADVDVQVKLAEDEVAQHKQAVERRTRIAERIGAAGVNLEALERQVLAGELAIDSYVAALTGAGVTAAETGILVGLLVEQLEAAAAGAALTGGGV